MELAFHHITNDTSLEKLHFIQIQSIPSPTYLVDICDSYKH